jgi:hypothetical protein
MKNVLLAAILIALSSPSIWCGDPIPPEKIEPGIERGAWSMEAWGNSGAADRTLNAPRMLKVSFIGGEKDKTAFKHLTYFGIARNGKIRMQVYAPIDKAPAIALALNTTQLYEWHESKTFTLKQGWNTIEIPVEERVWKTKGTNWEFKARVEPQEEIRAVTLLIYNGKESGALYVYGLHYDPDVLGERILGLAQKMKSEDHEEREQAEKDLVAIGRPAMEVLMQLADDERVEVMLRAASAIRAIEKMNEPEPPDPKIRAELAKQREEQRFDEARRRATYALENMVSHRARMLQLMQDAHKELLAGCEEAAQLQLLEPEKKKAYLETLDKIEANLKELDGVLKTPKPEEPKKN